MIAAATLSLHAQSFETPFGTMVAAVDDSGRLARLLFPAEAARLAPGGRIVAAGESVEWGSGRCGAAVDQVRAFLRGEIREFDLELAPRGTPFQLKVWDQLRAIPYGTTISYGELARRVGNPAASRAVGRANGTNPIPVVVPCHRVIGASGTLTGFGGGLDLKRDLLRLEGVAC